MGKIHVTKTTTTKIEMVLDGEEIINALRGVVIPDSAVNVTVRFHVPRGGDYSGMDLDLIGNDVIIQYTDTVEETDDERMLNPHLYD